ncbi:MAG: hypothetical protein EON58_02680 [Alphaproteobacteria bacterium]|nr:MAG: hypothetical protein EON58_02680 [Alphaproteobacteria bacterium]
MGNRANGEEGFALVVVLAFLMLFAVFLTPFATSARLQVLISGNQFQTLRLGSAANALNDFLNWQINSDVRWREAAERGDLDKVGCTVGSLDLSVTIIPHATLINLNTAEAPLLESGLQRLGINRESALKLVSEVLEFRTPRGYDGVGDGISSGLKRAPFEDISEMHDFSLLRAIPIWSLAKVFSAWSGQSLLSVEDHAKGSSRHFTIASWLFEKGNVGSDAAVYAVGGATATKSRLATISQDMGSEDGRTEMDCNELLGPKGVQVLAEIAG